MSIILIILVEYKLSVHKMTITNSYHFILILLCFKNADVTADKLQVYGVVPGLDPSPYYKIQVRQGGQ